MRLILLILFFVQFLPFSSQLFAQESVLSGSGTATGEGGTQTFSIGQVAFRYAEGQDGTITEGVQQPYEILLFEGIPEENGIALTCSVNPNPATSFVRLTMKKNEISDMRFQLVTLRGIILQDEMIKEKITIIPVEKYSEGYFLLKVMEDEKILAIFKIIKR